MGALGERYGSLIAAWWFDSSYSMDPRGPVNTVTTELGDWEFPWDRYAVQGRKGFPERLVTFNAGIGETYRYSELQDYWAGEVYEFRLPSPSEIAPLAPHAWTCLDDLTWLYASNAEPPLGPRAPDGEVLRFFNECRDKGCPLCFNVLIDQTGDLNEASLSQLRRVWLAS